MNPLILEELAQQHIQDLHREARLRGLARSRTKQESHRRTEAAIWFRRAFAS